MKQYLFSCLIILSFVLKSKGQETEIVESEKIHKIAFVVGLTHIPKAFEEGKASNSVFVPSIGLDYFIQFSKGWKIGTVLDLELNNYIVDFNRENLDREKALVTGILVGYEFSNHWSFLIGPGIEFEKNKNLFIIRSSIEYEFEIGEDWGLFPSINFDLKEEYSTYSINIGISKRL